MVIDRAFVFGSIRAAVVASLDGLLSVALLGGSFTAYAQRPAETRSGRSQEITASVTTPTSDPRYRVGPGDLLEVRVQRTPELSRDAVRVDERGMIRLPMIDNEVRAACLTEGELGKKIATLYAEYKHDPRVDIF